MDFTPEAVQQDAGLVFYYDNMNYIYLHKYLSESLSGPAIMVQRMENGVRSEFDATPVDEGPLDLRLVIDGLECWMEWAPEGDGFRRIGPAFDTSELSDEYCRYGEFTGSMVGIACTDRLFHARHADFDFLEMLVGQPN